MTIIIKPDRKILVAMKRPLFLFAYDFVKERELNKNCWSHFFISVKLQYTRSIFLYNTKNCKTEESPDFVVIVNLLITLLNDFVVCKD